MLPYRVMAKSELIDAMAGLGYVVADQWESQERHLKVPFEPNYNLDHYSGFYFKRA
ncbi:hypothetical protein D3C80_2001130 [compost metagenome]